MAVWVHVNHAAEFPEVKRVYKRAGWGQGTGQTTPGPSGVNGPATPASGVKGFLNTVKYYVTGASRGVITLPSWIRLAPLAATAGNSSWQNAQVDVTNIPGVRALMANGKPAGFAPL